MDELGQRMPWLFLGFDAHQYIQCTLLNELHKDYLRIFEHPAILQMRLDIRSCNEERGELTLSLLANAVGTDPEKSEVEKLDASYAIINYCRDIIKQICDEHQLKSAPAHPLNISSNVRDQDLVFEATAAVITSMRNGTYRCRCPSTPTIYEPTGPTESRSQPRFLRSRVSDEINVELQKISTLLTDTNLFDANFAAHPIVRDRREGE